MRLRSQRSAKDARDSDSDELFIHGVSPLTDKIGEVWNAFAPAIGTFSDHKREVESHFAKPREPVATPPAGWALRCLVLVVPKQQKTAAECRAFARRRGFRPSVQAFGRTSNIMKNMTKNRISGRGGVFCAEFADFNGFDGPDNAGQARPALTRLPFPKQPAAGLAAGGARRAGEGSA